MEAGSLRSEALAGYSTGRESFRRGLRYEGGMWGSILIQQGPRLPSHELLDSGLRVFASVLLEVFVHR